VNVFVAAVLFAAAATLASVQDAVSTLPESYTLQFENEWVRVVRVRYGPHAKLPAHAHNKTAAAYVYLNASGPVIFRHVGTDYGAVTRPATRAGGFRLYRAVDEIHEVENTTAEPSDFLRVEFKTEPREDRLLRGRFNRDGSPETHIERVQFENAQVRVTRILVGPKRRMDVAAGADPALLIALTATPIGAPGKERWVPAGSTVALENKDAEPAELLRFDLKTRPLPVAR